MGQNMVGWTRSRLTAPAGTTITLRHAEVLDKAGNFYTANLRSAEETIRYTAKGQGTESFQPHFTFQGFRYVSVSGWPGEVNPEDFTGMVVHSAVARTGSFEASNPLLNRLQHNIIWGQKGNFLDVPTDCPQRDERLGWTGDAQVFARDRKSTRLNSSHGYISYAVFCLQKTKAAPALDDRLTALL